MSNILFIGLGNMGSGMADQSGEGRARRAWL